MEELQDSTHNNSIAAVEERKINFLNIYTQTESIYHTCERINIKPATFKRWIKNDNVFKNKFNKIKERIGL